MSVKSANKLSEQDGLLVICMAAHQTAAELSALKDKIIAIANKHEGNINILVDVSAVKSSDNDTDTIAKTFFKNLPFTRMAVYGGSRVVNVGIRLILNLFISPGVGEVKLFRSEEKARAWLQKVRNSD